MPGIDLRQATLSWVFWRPCGTTMAFSFRCARPPHARSTWGNGTPIRQQLLGVSSQAQGARGVRQSGQISQFRDAPKKCAAVLTGAHHLARTPKSLARNNKTGCGRSGNGIQCHRVSHFAAEPTSSGRTNHEPRRRACLAFACLVCRSLRCGDLGVISALMAKRRYSEPSHYSIRVGSRERI